LSLRFAIPLRFDLHNNFFESEWVTAAVPLASFLPASNLGVHREMKILIVDDDKAFCQFLSEILEKKGHAVDSTSYGVEGYKMSQRKFYDLFIFDVRMPLLTGTELAEGLRQQSPATKIILISAFADETLQHTANSIGVPLLSKPFATEAFLDLVMKTINQ
jgi:DNA-binding response OmpR family regulator